MVTLCLLAAAFSLIGLGSCLGPSHKLVLVVLDGFSPIYLGNDNRTSFHTFNTTHLESLTIVKNVTSEFPASRLPFLAALANGMHSLENRVLGNQWRQDLDDASKVFTADQHEFWTHVHRRPLIWELNDKIDEYHSSRVAGWPYYDQLIQAKPNQSADATVETSPVASSVTLESMANMTKEWLADEHVNFVTLYSDEPGRSSEIYGPESGQAKAAVAKVDAFIGQLLEDVVDLQKVNLVVVTTPGYVDVSLNTVVDLTNYNKGVDYVQVSNGTILGVQPPHNSDQIALYQKYEPKKSGKDFEVFSHSDFPPEWHFHDHDHDQLPLITLVANEGHVFKQDFHPQRLNKLGGRPDLLSNHYGATGYDNRLESMKTLVLVAGPSFAKDKDIASATAAAGNASVEVTVVDIHCLLCHILGISPEDVHGGLVGEAGQLEKLSFLLRYKPDNILSPIKEIYDLATEGKNLPIALALIISACTLICVFMVCMVCCCKKRCCKPKTSLDAQFRYTKVNNRRRPVAEYRDEDDTKGLLRDTDMDALPDEDTA